MYYTIHTCTAPEQRSWVPILGCSAVALLSLLALAHHQSNATSLAGTAMTQGTMVRPAIASSAPSRIHPRHAAITHLRPGGESDSLIQQPLVPQPHTSSSMTWPAVLVSTMVGAVVGFVAGSMAKRAPPSEESPMPRAHWGAGLTLAAALTVPQMFGSMDVALAGLPTANVISDPQVLLANALPTDNKEIYKMEQQLEGITRLPEAGAAMRSAVSDVASSLANDQVRANIVNSFVPEKKAQGTAAIEAFQTSLQDLRKAIDSGDKPSIVAAQKRSLKLAGDIQSAMVKGFPFEVPAKYAALPQLKGRATVECKIKFNNNVNIKEGVLTIVVDGYNAPVTAGNYVDLVNRKFYDGMEIQRADGFVVQTGDPAGPEDGFVDPKTGQVRTIPFEVKVAGTPEPYYESTLEDLGVYNAPVALPFNAFGTMALARNDTSSNSGSSQFFWLLKDAELTPIGNNVLDGRYAAFGYIVDNEELLKEVKVGDQIVYMKVISGLDKLVPGDAKAPPVTFDF